MPAFLIVIAGGVGFVWMLGGGEPNNAVDYVARMNERAAAVPEEERAWPVYLEAARFAGSRSDEDENFWVEIRSLTLPSDPGWPLVEAGLRERSELLPIYRRAASIPDLGYVVSAESADEYRAAAGIEPAPDVTTWNLGEEARASSKFHTELMHLGVLRRAANLLVHDTVLAGTQGDSARARENLSAALSISTHCEQPPELMSQVVADAVRKLVFRGMTEIVLMDPGLFSDEDLGMLSASVSRLHGGDRITLDMTHERDSVHDVVQRVFTDDGRGSGRLTAEALPYLRDLGAENVFLESDAAMRFLFGLANLSGSGRRTVVAEYDRMVSEIEAWDRSPLWERGEAVAYQYQERWEAAAKSMPPDLGLGLLAILLPNIDKAHVRFAWTSAERDAALVVMACERWRLAHGAWPETLGVLVPEYLERVPADPYADSDIGYRVGPHGPVVYSVGADEDDDGGIAADEASTWLQNIEVAIWLAEDPAARDGDWVLASPNRAGDGG